MGYCQDALVNRFYVFRECFGGVLLVPPVVFTVQF